ncbi:menaquinol-cytochrome c reductase cytochrome b/c subunit [Risungbinella massiliensis]|uniref:menaquinol-cytochrome c reductase cytochrome b/c subunit n=1 Tax=Risungbinella massiliensis TaxID=1329796 RepID=UPI0005CC8AB5|nr:menaquinol-cytochrome c reductase cytochrome b/c subunit [Risungbinella massiliensis]
MAHTEEGTPKKQVLYVGDSRVRADRPKQHIPDYSEFPGKNEAFIPDFLLKEWMVAAVFLVGFMTLVMAEEPPLGELADPTNTGFLPVPDWYFLFLYQLLKYKWAAGDFVVIGTLVVPGLLFGALMLVPWLDRSKERQPLKRSSTTWITILSLVAIAFLTWAAEYQHVQQLESAPSTAPKNKVVVEQNSAGYDIYSQSACITCHGDNLEGKNGPSLLGVGNKFGASEKGESHGNPVYTREDLKKIIDHGRGAMPQGMFQGTDEQKEVLMDWLLKQNQK